MWKEYLCSTLFSYCLYMYLHIFPVLRVLITRCSWINYVLICLPSKGAGQEKRINTKYTSKKRGRSGEGGGNQKQLPTPSNKNDWQAHGLPFYVTCEKARRGVGHNGLCHLPQTQSPWLSIKLWSKRKDKNSIREQIFYMYMYLHIFPVLRVLITRCLKSFSLAYWFTAMTAVKRHSSSGGCQLPFHW